MQIEQVVAKLCDMGYEAKNEDNIVIVYSDNTIEISKSIRVLLSQWGYNCSWGVKYKPNQTHCEQNDAAEQNDNEI